MLYNKKAEEKLSQQILRSLNIKDVKYKNDDVVKAATP